MPPQKSIAELVVEGKNDQHVVWALCQNHHVPQTFSVKMPDTDASTIGKGVEALLASIPVRLKSPGLHALGIVLDADENIESRWQAVANILQTSGYNMLPKLPERHGTIIPMAGRPTVGVWIMPDNELPGMLEHFVAHLIPEGDELATRAESVLLAIEQENLHRYASGQQAKAFIHTWLAWQENPGQPMGQAITARALNYNAPLANRFVDWLRRLFPEDVNSISRNY